MLTLRGEGGDYKNHKLYVMNCQRDHIEVKGKTYLIMFRKENCFPQT